MLTKLEHLFHGIVVAARFGGVALMPLLLRQQIFNGAVQRQIRVTTNRRGKVRIRLQRQAEVTTVFRIVNRLFHGAQQHGLQHFRIRTIADGLQQLGVIARLWFTATRQLQAQLRQHRTERGDRFSGRFIVNTEQRRLFGFLNETRRRDVCQDHALFNQFVGIVTLRLLDTLDTTLSVEDKLRLFALKGDPAALFARLVQHFVEVVQLFDVFDQRRILLAQLLVALQHVPDFGVCQARVRAHHCFIEFIAG
ncbi:hypothetical protein D3C72_1252840 [compost metagenome]